MILAQAETVGISAIGYYIPEKRMTCEDIAKLANIPVSMIIEEVGVEKKPIAAENEHPSDMGVKAAQDAIKKAGIKPEEIDLIAYCGAGDYDYRHWSPSAKIQNEIGAKNAVHAFEIRNGCQSGILGIYICQNLLLADPEINCALVICSDKFSHNMIDYSDLEFLDQFRCADGAIAVILKKGEGNNRILGYSAIVQGEYADGQCIQLGGTKFNWKDYNNKSGYLKQLVKTDEIKTGIIFLLNYIKVIQKVLEKSKYTKADIDWLFTNQISVNLSQQIISAMGLKIEQTMLSMREYGHLGAGDPLFGLVKMIEVNQIKPGNLVVLASSGNRVSWGAMTIKF